jgi:site-specific recombinase XerD
LGSATTPAAAAGTAGSDRTPCGTFATQLIRAGADPVLVADLLGHASLDTLRAYTQPNDEDREYALGLLTTDG